MHCFVASRYKEVLGMQMATGVHAKNPVEDRGRIGKDLCAMPSRLAPSSWPKKLRSKRFSSQISSRKTVTLALALGVGRFMAAVNNFGVGQNYLFPIGLEDPNYSS